MELTIRIDQSKKEARALLNYLRSLPYVDISQVSEPDRKVSVTAAGDFVKKWKGFLKSEDIDDARYEYLSNKYR